MESLDQPDGVAPLDHHAAAELMRVDALNNYVLLQEIWNGQTEVVLEAPINYLYVRVQVLIGWVMMVRDFTREEASQAALPTAQTFGPMYAVVLLAIYDSLSSGSREHLEQLQL